MKVIVFILIIFQSTCYSQGILGSRSEGDGLPSNPSLLTWTKIHEERFYNVVDENHVKYTSDFATSTSNLSAVTGSAPSISGGNLVVDGTVKYKSTSTSVAAWTTVEMTVSTMGSVGDSNKLGPMFIKDADEYIAAVYDKPNTRLQIIQNDFVLFSLPYTVNTTNCKIFLVVSGNSLSVWYQEDGEDLTCGFSYNSIVDLKALVGGITDYKYGIYSLQSGGTTTHNISSLRGAASGGVGMFNNKIVRNLDGSEFLLDGNLLMTVDMMNISSSGFAYNDANSVVISIDTATFGVEIIGRLYFDRSSKRLGGQDLHVIWNGSQWLVNYVPADNVGLAENSDYYFFLDSAELFTEVVVPAADLTIIGFPTSCYDVSTRIIDGVFKAAVTQSLNACLYSGADLDDMDNVSCYSSEEDWECGQWYRYKGQWWLSYSSFGDTRQIVLTYPDMELVGYMDLPFEMDDRIPGYDWYTKQVNGRTTYHMIGFDTHEFTATIPIYGVTQFPWTLGNLVVWKAAETKTGYEF